MNGIVPFDEAGARTYQKPAAISVEVLSGLVHPADARLAHYHYLDSEFRRELGEGPGDFSIAMEQMAEGKRVVTMALLGEYPVGFERLDAADGVALLGALYIEPEFRNLPVRLTETQWLRAEECKRVWQLVLKGLCIIGSRAGYARIGSYDHAGGGFAQKLAWPWRRRYQERWDAEATESAEPADVVGFLRR